MEIVGGKEWGNEAVSERHGGSINMMGSLGKREQTIDVIHKFKMMKNIYQPISKCQQKCISLMPLPIEFDAASIKLKSRIQGIPQTQTKTQQQYYYYYFYHYSFFLQTLGGHSRSPNCRDLTLLQVFFDLPSLTLTSNWDPQLVARLHLLNKQGSMKKKRAVSSIKQHFNINIYLSVILYSSYMKELSLAWGILLFATFAGLALAQYDPFSVYVVNFNKNYNATEYAAREIIYNAKIASFSNIVSFTPGINQYTDWTDEEIKGLSNLKELPQEQKKSSEDMPKVKLGAPASVDWRTQNILTSIKDQGGCGACWAFTSAALVQSFLVQTGKQSTSIDLSEQFILECTSGSNCGGGYIEHGLDKIKQKCAQEAQFGYVGPSLYGGSICSADGITTKTKRSSYYDITDTELINLLQYRPVAVAVSSNGWSSYSSGTITCSPSDPVDHAVIAVGYTANAYIIRNSWATTWGLNGYALVSRSASSNCKILSQAHVVTVATFEVYRLLSLVLLLGLLIFY